MTKPQAPDSRPVAARHPARMGANSVRVNRFTRERGSHVNKVHPEAEAAPLAVSRVSHSAGERGRCWWEWASLGLILLLAAGLRFWRLDRVPPGLTHDEAGHGQDAIAILRGARPLYETIGYGREPLYDYVVAAAMAISGRTDYLTLRGVSAAFGLLTIVGAYLWVRRAFGPGEALLSCAWLAGSFWAVSVSRQALRSVMLPALLAAAAYAWWRGAFDDGGPEGSPRRGWLWFALSGLFVGATLWNYMAARVTWALFLALPLYLWATDRARFKRRWPGMLATLVVAGALAAPMFFWLWRHPGAEQRFSQLGRPLHMLAAGDLGQIAANSLEALKMFTVRADDLWMYNLPGRPWLGKVEGALFYVGLALACWRWRRPPYAMALTWLVLGISPSMITGVSASATRAVAILPVLYLFPALALTEAYRVIQSRTKGSVLGWARGTKPPDTLPAPVSGAAQVNGAAEVAPGTGLPAGTKPSDTLLAPVSGASRVGGAAEVTPGRGLRAKGSEVTTFVLKSLLVVLSVCLVVLAGVRTYHDYFDVWGDARDVRVAYHTTLFEIARYLDRGGVPPGATVLVSSIYPGRYHDPYAMDLILSRRDLSLRWMDGRGALVFPADPHPAHLIVPALAPLDPALDRAIAPSQARLVGSYLLHPDDLNPGFDVYEWDSAAALERLLPQAARRPVAWSGSAIFPADDPQSVYRELHLPADLGHAIALLGYDLSSPTAAPGDEVTVVTYWRVQGGVRTPGGASTPPAVGTEAGSSSPPLAGGTEGGRPFTSPGQHTRPELAESIVLFTHLLTPTGGAAGEDHPPVVAQQDRLDAPDWNWHAGEVFAQVHRLTIGDEVPAGLYPLEVGAYRRATPSPIDPDPPATRLALYVEGQAVSDRILLPPLQVRR